MQSDRQNSQQNNPFISYDPLQSTSSTLIFHTQQQISQMTSQTVQNNQQQNNSSLISNINPSTAQTSSSNQQRSTSNTISLSCIGNVSQAQLNKRKEKDVMKLVMSDYEVICKNEDTRNNEFIVKLLGPLNSIYEGGHWYVRVTLPDQYPYKSPSIGFINRIFHPNIDENSGSVCLDVINQTWSPMFDLVNIFEVFLPQLLQYPNPKDPLNGEAAKLLNSSEEAYNKKVREHTLVYANEESVRKNPKVQETLKIQIVRAAQIAKDDNNSKSNTKNQTLEEEKVQGKSFNNQDLDSLSETSLVDIEDNEDEDEEQNDLSLDKIKQSKDKDDLCQIYSERILNSDEDKEQDKNLSGQILGKRNFTQRKDDELQRKDQVKSKI